MRYFKTRYGIYKVRVEIIKKDNCCKTFVQIKPFNKPFNIVDISVNKTDRRR